MDLLILVAEREPHPVFGSVEHLDLEVGPRRELGLASRHPDVPALQGLLSLDWRRVDRVYEEDELRTELLEPSGRRSSCQYKGDADHFHVRLGDRLAEDLVWRYVAPRTDGRRILGRTTDGRLPPAITASVSPSAPAGRETSHGCARRRSPRRRPGPSSPAPSSMVVRGRPCRGTSTG